MAIALSVYGRARETKRIGFMKIEFCRFKKGIDLLDGLRDGLGFKMKTYYINQVDINGIDGCYSDWDHHYVGLFTNNEWHGEGDFCGWYGVEFYSNTILLAFYQEVGDGGSAYTIEGKGELHICREKFDKVMIGSCYWESTIEANSDEEAIEIFRKNIKSSI